MCVLLPDKVVWRLEAHLSQSLEDIGIVLRSLPFKERDKLVTILTENHGRVAGVARNAIHSKRFGGTLDLFACSHFRYKDARGDLIFIEEANLRRDFVGLRTKLENLSAAGYFCDLILRVTEERHPAREVFLLLAHYLHLLENHTATVEIVRSFEIKLLERLGWAPVLEECVSCQSPFFGEELSPEESFVTLAVEQGGFLCHHCATPSSRRFPLASVLWMIQARETKIQHTPDLKFPLDPMLDAATALQHFLRWHCPGLGNYQFRSHEMLEGFLMEAREERKAMPLESPPTTLPPSSPAPGPELPF